MARPADRSTSPDVLVVGAGLAGTSLAWHLAGRASVCVLEQNLQACAEASAQNAGMLRRLVPGAGERALVQRSLELLREPPAEDWLDGSPFRRTGAVIAFASARSKAYAPHAAAAVALRRDGVRVEELAGSALAAAAPAFAGSTVERAFWLPDDGVVDPHALGSGFVRGARRRGAELRFDTRVLSLLRDGDRVLGVETDRGTLHAGTVVLASAAWTRRLLPEVRLRPLARHLFYSDPHPLAAGPWCWVQDAGLYVRPETGAFLCSPCDETEVAPPLGPGSKRAIDDVVRARAHELLEAHLPAIAGLRLRQGWVGLRTFAPDREPLVGPDAARPGLFWLTGLGGSGVGASFALGERAAALLLGGGRDAAARG